MTSRAPGRRVRLVSSDARARALGERLEAAGVEVQVVAGPPSATDACDVDVVLMDVSELGEDCRLERGPDRRSPTYVLLADDPAGETALLALRIGADTVASWSSADDLSRILGWDGVDVDPTSAGAPLPPFIIGSAPAMREVWRRVFLIAPSDSSVLILGETGAGKEVVARALHRFSGRRAGPFVAVNCAALPGGLLESELFGHERGAFTGATTRRQGRFELADGGTLLLDEIGDMPLELQAKLLRVLQERRFERLGGTESIAVDVRVISATHQDLAETRERGEFRADLWYRLNALTIRVPPLRECREDVLHIFHQFLEREAARRGRPPPELSEASRRMLLRHEWPGNVRELKNAATHALTLCTSRTIEPHDLPEPLGPASPSTRALPLLGLTFEEVERELILQTHAALGSTSATAQMLGISVRKVQYRLKDYRGEEDAGGDPSCDTEATVPARTGPHVLLAEDDDELRWALEDFLEAGGFDVTAVSSGDAALELLAGPAPETKPPAVLVTDVRMPGLDGLQLVRAIRRQGSDLPVIVISAFVDGTMRGEAQSLGASVFLPKPIDSDELQRAIRRAVG